MEPIEESKVEECSICFNDTENRTECNHVVCVECRPKITKCCICRKELKPPKIPNPFYDNLDPDDEDYDILRAEGLEEDEETIYNNGNIKCNRKSMINITSTKYD